MNHETQGQRAPTSRLFGKALAAVLGAFLSAGCSFQMRSVDAFSEQDFQQAMIEIGDRAAGISLAEFDDLFTDPESAVYFADSQGGFGPAQSVISIENLALLGGGLPQASGYDLDEASVVLVDGYRGGERRMLMLVQVLRAGSQAHDNAIFSATELNFSSGEFSAVMADSSGREMFTLVSYDIARPSLFTYSEDLAEAIQLQVYAADPATPGYDRWIGRFPTLKRF